MPAYPSMLSSELPVTNELLSALSRSEYLDLLPHLESVELTEGELLTEPGQPLRYVYFPTTALLSLLTLVDGNEVFAVGFAGRESMSSVASALGSQVSPFRTLVLSSGTSQRMKTKTFLQEFHQRAAFRDVVLKYVLSLTLQIAQTSACNRYHVIEQRLARWLLMMRDRLSSNHIHMTHELLGHLLGVRRVGVTNAAHALKERALIDYNRGLIDILDSAGLQAAACSCYHAPDGRHGRT